MIQFQPLFHNDKQEEAVLIPAKNSFDSALCRTELGVVTVSAPSKALLRKLV